MNLNYLAFFLIAFVPLILAYLWYHPKNNFLANWKGDKPFDSEIFRFPKVILFFLLSFTIVYGYINLVIHQMGFYELFFTDIMQGNEASKKVVDDFLSIYGDKHRHFGHGVFHGVINAFVFAIPFLGIYALLEKVPFKNFLYHFMYWLICSAIIGGLIAEFV